MAHFAELNDQYIVDRVVVVNNGVIDNQPFPESEQSGIVFLKNLYGENTTWAQTSYNANFRVHYAGVGYTFDTVLNAFIPPKPYPSWLLNTENCVWEPPVPYPDDGKDYVWDEEVQNWVLYSPPVAPIKIARAKSKSTIA